MDMSKADPLIQTVFNRICPKQTPPALPPASLPPASLPPASLPPAGVQIQSSIKTDACTTDQDCLGCTFDDINFSTNKEWVGELGSPKVCDPFKKVCTTQLFTGAGPRGSCPLGQFLGTDRYGRTLCIPAGKADSAANGVKCYRTAVVSSTPPLPATLPPTNLPPATLPAQLPSRQDNPVTTVMCDVQACNSDIQTYIKNKWRYNTSDFVSCKGCPVATNKQIDMPQIICPEGKKIRRINSRDKC
jgi:hypothetical protein